MSRWLCCLAFVVCESIGLAQNGVEECVRRAEEYKRSLKNGVAEVLVEQYTPEWEGDPSREGVYRKLTFRFGYAFDGRQRAIRVDSEELAAIFVKGSLVEPSDEVYNQMGADSASIPEIRFHYGATLAYLYCQAARILTVERNYSAPIHEDYLLDPAWLTSSFIDSVRRPVPPSWNNKCFISLAVTGTDNIHGTTQTVIKEEVLAKLGAGRLKGASSGEEPLFSNLVSRFWVNEHGYVERIVLCNRLLQEHHLYLSDNKSYRVGEGAPQLFCSGDFEARYRGTTAFPVEMVFRHHVPRIVNGKLRKESSIMLRYTFRNTRVNIPGFGPKDFFLYPEEETKIFLYEPNVELSADDYFQMFSDLDLETTKVVKRNRFFDPLSVK